MVYHHFVSHVHYSAIKVYCIMNHKINWAITKTAPITLWPKLLHHNHAATL